MAEAVLNIVLGKLADVIVKEAQLLGGVQTKIEGVQRDLTRIKCCLKDADSRRKGDESVQNWLNELRNVAYRIEDATDTYFLEVEDQPQKDSGGADPPQAVQQAPGGVQNSRSCCRCLQKLKKLFNKPLEVPILHKALKVPILHKLGNELDDIQNVLEGISKSRDTFGFRDLPQEDKSKGEANVTMPHRTVTYEEVDETKVVGMQTDKNNILELLSLDQKTSRRAIITIVGPGGLGKTTLAHMVYKSARANFDYHIMLPISQQFSLTDLLRKMISNCKDDQKDDQQVPKDWLYYVGKLKRILSSKRYLIILDDVWTVNLWKELNRVLPDDKNGSRVLMTSRSIEVARSADSQMPPYELNLLDDRESLDLLLKKALPYQECPIDLPELADKLSKKCKGLPLALVVLGGFLATKEQSYLVWKSVLETMTWDNDGRDCMQILEMSYEDMSYYLKACFQYLACFPEDYEISAKSLIRMWIAEGFIPLEGRSTIEKMAEDCLEELAKRSMVQVLSRSTKDLIKYFKVHDILRELAIREAGHENFVTVFSHASNDTKPNGIIRRASLQAEEKNSQFMKYVGPNTRSLLSFEPKNSEMRLLQWSNFRLLKVLVIVGKDRGRERKYELKSLDELIHLKYMELRGFTRTILSSCSFHRMKRLETLDVRDSGVRGFWTIGTLMHVLIDKHSISAIPPISIATLSNLRTLKWVTVKGPCDLKLPNLRKLAINNDSKEWVSTTNLLQTLPFLVSLRIYFGRTIPLPMEIVYPTTLPNYQNLHFLYLDGIWPENVKVDASLFPPHLVKLALEHSELNHDPMPELGKLNSLKKLHLGSSVLTDEWKGPIICLEGFPALKYLKVGYNPQIRPLTVAQGVMPKLTYLQVHDSNHKVHLPPELQHRIVQIPWKYAGSG